MKKKTTNTEFTDLVKSKFHLFVGITSLLGIFTMLELFFFGGGFLIPLLLILIVLYMDYEYNKILYLYPSKRLALRRYSNHVVSFYHSSIFISWGLVTYSMFMESAPLFHILVLAPCLKSLRYLFRISSREKESIIFKLFVSIGYTRTQIMIAILYLNLGLYFYTGMAWAFSSLGCLTAIICLLSFRNSHHKERFLFPLGKRGFYIFYLLFFFTSCSLVFRGNSEVAILEGGLISILFLHKEILSWIPNFNFKSKGDLQ